MASTSSAVPQVEELGTDSYACASFVRGTTLSILEPIQALEWPMSITYMGEEARLCQYEDDNGEPIVQGDGVPFYDALHRNIDSSENLPILGKSMFEKPGLHWAPDGLRFEGEHQVQHLDF
ncbi:uncharacterized protein LOC110006459 [Amborella trichopoda]|uniref:uncharacterized protein LOC110006459 n=1 Tax=Amborella trichopoda TaxID=13333 RepID=UPI0009C078D2|nr:uncharacterized protein LOC110006459 [Amborella trichopoda]|eukprot:XP_020517635.1 uncharacterized protein LOC110006459 [Amborella trichopoda]